MAGHLRAGSAAEAVSPGPGQKGQGACACRRHAVTPCGPCNQRGPQLTSTDTCSQLITERGPGQMCVGRKARVLWGAYRTLVPSSTGSPSAPRMFVSKRLPSPAGSATKQAQHVALWKWTGQHPWQNKGQGRAARRQETVPPGRTHASGMHPIITALLACSHQCGACLQLHAEGGRAWGAEGGKSLGSRSTC